MYTFEFQLDEKDYVEFNRTFQISELKRVIKPWHMILFTAVALTSLFLGITGSGSIPIILVILACLMAALLLIIVFWKYTIIWYIKFNIKHMKKRGKLPFGKNVRTEFDEESFMEISELAESKVAYDNVERILEDSNAIYIFISSIQAFILPHRIFESEQQKADFLAFINGKVPAK